MKWSEFEDGHHWIDRVKWSEFEDGHHWIDRESGQNLKMDTIGLIEKVVRI